MGWARGWISSLENDLPPTRTSAVPRMSPLPHRGTWEPSERHSFLSHSSWLLQQAGCGFSSDSEGMRGTLLCRNFLEIGEAIGQRQQKFLSIATGRRSMGKGKPVVGEVILGNPHILSLIHGFMEHFLRAWH